MRKSVVAYGATLLATALVVAGCGSSGDGSTAAVSGGTNKATGAPVKVMAIVDESKAQNVTQDFIRAGDEAAVKAINDNGNGLGGSGRPIELEFCVTNLDPNQAAACARKAADDPSYVAMVGGIVTEKVDSTLKDAGLAVIPGLPATPDDLSLDNVFNISGGGVTSSAGEVEQAVSLGAKNVTVLGSQLAAGQVSNQYIDSVLKFKNLPQAKTVAVPLTASDLSSYVATASQDTGAVIDGLAPPAQTPQALKERQTQGIDTPFIILGLNVNQKMLDTVGSAGDGTQVTSFFPTADSGVAGAKQYVTDMQAAGKEAYISDFAAGAWVSFQLLNTAAKGLTDLNRDTVMKALNGVTDFTGDGMTPPLNFTKPGPNPTYPRIFNWTYFPAKIEDGKLVVSGDGKLTAIDPSSV